LRTGPRECEVPHPDRAEESGSLRFDPEGKRGHSPADRAGRTRMGRPRRRGLVPLESPCPQMNPKPGEIHFVDLRTVGKVRPAKTRKAPGRFPSVCL